MQMEVCWQEWHTPSEVQHQWSWFWLRCSPPRLVQGTCCTYIQVRDEENGYNYLQRDAHKANCYCCCMFEFWAIKLLSTIFLKRKARKKPKKKKKRKGKGVPSAYPRQPLPQLQPEPQPHLPPQQDIFSQKTFQEKTSYITNRLCNSISGLTNDRSHCFLFIGRKGRDWESWVSLPMYHYPMPLKKAVEP